MKDKKEEADPQLSSLCLASLAASCHASGLTTQPSFSSLLPLYGALTTVCLTLDCNPNLDFSLMVNRFECPPIRAWQENATETADDNKTSLLWLVHP